jgi:hypothetical protein
MSSFLILHEEGKKLARPEITASATERHVFKSCSGLHDPGTLAGYLHPSEMLSLLPEVIMTLPAKVRCNNVRKAPLACLNSSKTQ